jgi:hypothetical protein
MTLNPGKLPAIALYIELIDSFAGGEISASEFDRSFIRAMKLERRILGEPVYSILEELFEDADAYVERPELRTEPEDLDDEQLLSCALRSRESLRNVGYE